MTRGWKSQLFSGCFLLVFLSGLTANLFVWADSKKKIGNFFKDSVTTTKKTSVIIAVNKVIQELTKLIDVHKNRFFGEDYINKPKEVITISRAELLVSSAVSKLRTIDELVALAAECRTIAYLNTDDSCPSVRIIFEAAYNVSIRKIVAISGKDAYTGLRNLTRIFSYDGASAEFIEEAIDNCKDRRKK
jgi:hypothetical protein